MKSLNIYILGVLSGVLASALLLSTWNTLKMTKVHTLKQPLIVSSDNAEKLFSILPAGTTLYFDKSFPEGFTRYKIYINVDRTPLSLRELDDPTEIDPLEARSFDKPALMQALREYPLTRQQLAAILNSPQLTKQDVQEVLNDYLQKNK